MQKITPFLWFNDKAEAAAELYASSFRSGKITNVSRYGDEMPQLAGKVMIVNFEIAGEEFMALNGGPEFSFTPAVSFFVNCRTEEEVDALWARLSEGGQALMELGRYPFSPKFGWLNDKFGVSWQINLAGQPQKIAPFLMFVGEQNGKAEEGMRFYTSLFENSRIENIDRYGPGEGEKEGAVRHGRFTLHGQEFMALDSGLQHQFTFTPATSLFVTCEGQAEVDRLWAELTADGKEGQCGWLEDRYGVSWQIVPRALGELMNDPDPEKARRVTNAMLQMKKIDIAGLRRAYEAG